jgi:hypothetical protein
MARSAILKIAALLKSRHFSREPRESSLLVQSAARRCDPLAIALTRRDIPDRDCRRQAD